MEHISLFDKRLLLQDYHPQVVAYYYKQWDGFNMPFHTHRAIEIMYVISGTCEVETADTLLSLRKGDFILLDAHIKHRLIVEKGSPCRMLNIEFIFGKGASHFPSFKELTSQEPALSVLISSSKPFIVLRDPHDIYHTLKSLVIELDDTSQHNGLMAQLLLSQLLVRIARVVKEEDEQLLGPTHTYVRKSVEYMHQNYDCDIQVKHIAAAVNLHPGYLHRIFRNHMQCSIGEYLTSLRMEKAKMLLTHTDISVTDIADYVGINSAQYFSHMFRKQTGQTPLQYRNVDKERVNFSTNE